MHRAAAACIVAATVLCGCTVRYSARTGPSGSAIASQVSVSSGTPLGNAVIIGILLADGMRYFRLDEDSRALEADPARPINVQDCTRPVDPSAGNLLCR
jgi:hypothetical protein